MPFDSLDADDESAGDLLGRVTLGDQLDDLALAWRQDVLGRTFATLSSAHLHGFGRVGAANIGLTVLTRGEFSLVLASLALAAGLDARIGPFAAGYVLVLAVIGPIAVSASERLSGLLPQRLLPTSTDDSGAVALDLEAGTSSLYQLGTELMHIRVVPGSRLPGARTSWRRPGGRRARLLRSSGLRRPRCAARRCRACPCRASPASRARPASGPGRRAALPSRWV